VPLECVQRAGEVIYLPAGWKHLTVNVGEAIGVGSQVKKSNKSLSSPLL
jgi:quercetin dioxygenase-like cupin family protein